MTRTFFVFGLPRSGTAWLSTFLTGRDSFCYHDPTADVRLESLHDRMSRRPEAAVGAVDTSAFRDPKRFMDFMNADRYAVIVRDPAEIRASAARCGFDFNAEYYQQQMLDQLKGVPQFSYESLGNKNIMRYLWYYLIGTQMDWERADQLMEMKIERNVDLFLANRGLT